MKAILSLAERGAVPTPLLRKGIRSLLRARLKELYADESSSVEHHLEELRTSEISPFADRANEQHYELPEEFFGLVLGPRRKYSGCTFDPDDSDLGRAEVRSLLEIERRARLADGQRVLELGCGWGAISLWIAERFPQSTVHAVSNSRSQKAYIEDRARRACLPNLVVHTADIADFDARSAFGHAAFDRVVSVEMFEHVRNWEALLRRIRAWMTDDGALFTHVFAHRCRAYTFEDRGPGDWMARHFFTGGQMPVADQFSRVRAPFETAEHWQVDGTHYARTAAAWRANLERERPSVLPILAAVHGAKDAPRAFQRWRLFFLACEELFGFDGGGEWLVSHTLMRPLDARSSGSIRTGVAARDLPA